MDNTSFIQTKQQNCLGCNKCVFVCPTNANESFFESDEGKVFIKPGYCVSCGECIDICDHNARDFEDDTERFFKDIENGEKISVVVAPSLINNFSNVNNIYGYLKSIGVNKIYDVSLGADICTWAHVKLLKEGKIKNIISQPCPVVVSYIEKNEPTLIKHLSPVHSPVISTAVYLQKYLGVNDKIMFLSPCIGKKRECIIDETKGILEYNVTFTKFKDYLTKNSIDTDRYPPVDFDNIKGSIGFTFPRPGGLYENIRYHYGKDIWIKQIEGIKDISEYLKAYREDVEQGNPVPVIVDALNCKNGCNLGTGTSKAARINEIDYKFNLAKSKVLKNHSDKLMNHFDETLNIDDFERVYVDRSSRYKRDDSIDLEAAYISLGKISAADRNINCFCCGYGNCHDFVYDLATGHNDKNNCRHYLLNKFKKISMVDNLTETKSRYCYNDVITSLIGDHPEFVGIIFVDINGLKQVNDKLGHAFGDELIINSANLLKSIFNNMVYRIGGDEFVILCDRYSESEFLDRVSKLQEELKKHTEVNLSYGTSSSRQGTELEVKLEEADKAMYKAKKEYYSRKSDDDRRKTK